MTSDQLKALSKNSLCTVGSHSINHVNLRQSDKRTSANEIIDSKFLIEKIINQEVKYFAYPYGSIYAVSTREISLVKEAGYKLAVATLRSSLSKIALKNNLFLPRININESNYKTII